MLRCRQNIKRGAFCLQPVSFPLEEKVNDNSTFEAPQALPEQVAPPLNVEVSLQQEGVGLGQVHAELALKITSDQFSSILTNNVDNYLVPHLDEDAGPVERGQGAQGGGQLVPGAGGRRGRGEGGEAQVGEVLQHQRGLEPRHVPALVLQKVPSEGS